MIEQLLQFIEVYFIPYGPMGLFAASVIEEIIAPIPSAGVMMGAGFFFLKGAWSAELLSVLIFTIALPISFGVTLGSFAVYGIAYASGKPALVRWGKWFGLSWNEIENAERAFERGYKDELLVFVLRVIPAVPSVAIAAYCGLVRMNLRTYAVFTFVGTFVRAAILALVGWKFGSIYEEYAAGISRIEDWVLAGLIALAAAFILFRVLRARKVRSDFAKPE